MEPLSPFTRGGTCVMGGLRPGWLHVPRVSPRWRSRMSPPILHVHVYLAHGPLGDPCIEGVVADHLALHDVGLAALRQRSDGELCFGIEEAFLREPRAANGHH